MMPPPRVAALVVEGVAVAHPGEGVEEVAARTVTMVAEGVVGEVEEEEEEQEELGQAAMADRGVEPMEVQARTEAEARTEAREERGVEQGGPLVGMVA